MNASTDSRAVFPSNLQRPPSLLELAEGDVDTLDCDPQEILSEPPRSPSDRPDAIVCVPPARPTPLPELTEEARAAGWNLYRPAPRVDAAPAWQERVLTLLAEIEAQGGAPEGSS
jgi:hypothetical protein